MPEYPNLPLFEEKSRVLLAANKVLAYDTVQDWSATVFIQIWPNTAGGFNKPNTIAGCAMTETYTTIMHERYSNQYLIFFGNEYAYRVYSPTDKFFEDMRKHCMADISKCKSLY